jgi:hypothetical protein
MKEVVRQTNYVPLIVKGKEIKLKVEPVAAVFGFLLIISLLSCVRAAYTEKTVVKEIVEVVKRDTVTVTKIRIKHVESPLSKRIVRDFTKAVSISTPQVKTKTYDKDGIPRFHGKTPYEIMVRHLKAHESFRPWEYPDGEYPSKGFGLNLTPEHIKWAHSQLGFHPKKRNWTFEEGLKLLVAYCDEHTLSPLRRQYPNLDDFQIVAYACHKYNTGNVKRFGYCCHSKSTKERCKHWCKNNGRKGHYCRDVRKAHHARRVFEVQLFNKTLPASKLEADRLKAIDLQKRYQ